MTTVYVTHDQVEAMTLGQRVAVMRDGDLQQVDTPQDALPPPGEPVRRRLHRLAVDEPRRGDDRRDGQASFGGFEIPLPARRQPATGKVILGIRPAGLRGRARSPTRRCRRIEVEATVVEELGSESHVIFPIDAPVVDADLVRAAADDEDAGGARRRRPPVALHGATVNAALEACARARASMLAVDSARFHFFDVDSGESLTDRQLAAVWPRAVPLGDREDLRAPRRASRRRRSLRRRAVPTPVVEPLERRPGPLDLVGGRQVLALDHRELVGWIAARPRWPSARPRRHDSASPSRSRTCG